MDKVRYCKIFSPIRFRLKTKRKDHEYLIVTEIKRVPIFGKNINIGLNLNLFLYTFFTETVK